ncbi:MAG: type II toxin-antitoxin system RelE/ParE family toxin [Woeseiaceae bacterium]
MDIRKFELVNGEIPFDSWIEKVRDLRAKARILVRLKRVELGNLGDCRSVGDGVSEMRIREGQGYRIYFAQKGHEVILLLCGGNKSTQQKDIELAKKYWRNYCENN